MQKNVTEYWLGSMHDESVRQKIAVVDEDRELTFGELFDLSAQIGTSLIDALPKRGVVCVYLPKCADTVAADMGILLAGCCYNNLDVQSPAERTSNIIAHIRPLAVVTSGKYEKKLMQSELSACPILLVEKLGASARDGVAITNRLAEVIDTDPCCIINTSGSTGTPKGVAMCHRGIIDFMDTAMAELGLDGSETIGSLSPVYFDIYTLELYLTLARQAKLVLIPGMLAAFPEKLAAFLAEQNVSLIFWVPTIMVNMANLDILAEQPLPELKKVLFAGEVFPMKHLVYWHEHLPNAMFVNMYGPIEITVDCLYHIVTDEDCKAGILPIGRPFRNTDVLILNEDNKECAIGEPGELCVRGSSLALGYYRDLEKTAQAFVQNPLNDAYPELIYRTGDLVERRADGEIMFLGRRDFQVKHLGYRIELGEIEAVALSLPFIDNACVLYDKEAKQIILVYEAREEASAKDIRLGIGKVLPKYCLPTTFHYVREMPRNPNGKIDRKSLQDLYAR